MDNSRFKFRAWDTMGAGKMVMMCGGKNNHFTSNDLIDEDDWKVMQFTGLLDKNGKEIYEGDVVQDEAGHKMTVIWSQEDCQFLAKYFTPTDLAHIELEYDSGKSTWATVIGNIYEHSHLLNPEIVP